MDYDARCLMVEDSVSEWNYIIAEIETLPGKLLRIFCWKKGEGKRRTSCCRSMSWPLWRCCLCGSLAVGCWTAITYDSVIVDWSDWGWVSASEVPDFPSVNLWSVGWFHLVLLFSDLRSQSVLITTSEWHVVHLIYYSNQFRAQHLNLEIETISICILVFISYL